MYSMTGYAEKSFTLTTKSGKSSNVFLSIKSFNNRYFESICKLSTPLIGLESAIIKTLKKDLVRGHVYCSIFLDDTSLFQESVKPSLPTARAYYEALTAIKENLQIAQPINLDHLVRIPNIFVVQESEIDEHSKDIIFKNLHDAIEKLQSARKQEGDNLLADIRTRFETMQKTIIKIEELFKKRMTLQKEKIQETLQEMHGQEDVFSDAQKSALYSMLDKLDLQEEITRFNSHLKRVHTIITSNEVEVGKKLDFTLQEMNREINTIAAKCSDSEISEHAINTKVEIEKVREQVQNII